MKRGKCPLLKLKECDPECVLYRKGLRYYEDGRASQPFEECAINIGVDCLEQLISRSIGTQKAIEESRNETHNLMEFFQEMAQKKVIEHKD
jgi:hypothetical protein